MVRFTAIAAALAACRPAPATPPRTPRSSPAVAIASMFPSDTIAYVVTPSLRGLWDRAEGDRLVAAARGDATRLFYRAEREVGVVPRPGALEAVGVDVDAPAGVAMVLDESSAGVPVLFLTLAEPGRFESALLQFAAREGYGRPGAAGEATLVRGDEVAWLVRDRVAFLLPRDADAIQRRLGTFTPGEPSLADSPAFRHALVGQLSRRTAVAGFLDVRAQLYAESGLNPRWEGPDAAAARAHLERRQREALQRARSEGATMQALARIDARYRTWRQSLRDDEVARGLRALWGEVEGVGFRLGLGDARAHLSARLDLPASAPLARLLGRARPARTPLKSLTAPPYAAVELTADPALLQKHLGALAPFLGRRFLPDSEGEVLGALDGTAAVVVTEGEGGPRLGARIGLRDATAAQKLLRELGRKGSLHADGDDLIVGVPGVPPVRVGVRGEAVVVSSHRTLFERLCGLPSAPSYGAQSHVARVLRRSRSAFVMGGAVGALVVGPVSPSLGPLPPSSSTAPPRGDREKVEAELARIDRELKLVERRRRGRFIAHRRAWAEALGQLAVTLGWSRGALRMELRWERDEGSLAGAVAQFLEGPPRRDDPALATDDLEALLGQLNAQRFELLGRLAELEGGGSVAPPQ